MPVRSSHSAEKRRKEMDRKRRAQEKFERRLNKRRTTDTEATDQPAAQDELPAENPAEPGPVKPTD